MIQGAISVDAPTHRVTRRPDARAFPPSAAIVPRFGGLLGAVVSTTHLPDVPRIEALFAPGGLEAPPPQPDRRPAKSASSARNGWCPGRRHPVIEAYAR